MRFFLTLGFIALLCSSPTIAEISLSIQSPGATSVDVKISWSDFDGALPDDKVLPDSKGGSTSLRNLEVSTPWEGRLDLDPLRTWKIKALAEGFWAPEKTWEPGQPTNLDVHLEPASKIAGRLELSAAEDATPPLDLQGWLNRTAVAKEKKPQWQSIDCVLVGTHFQCDLPISTLDLKLLSAGHVPVYRWGLEVGIEPLDLGKIPMHRGGSVSGHVVAEEVAEENAPIFLSLIPRTTGFQAEAAERHRTQLRALQTEANDKGFFTLGPVPAGGYDLEAITAGLAAQRVENLDLTTAQEIILDDVIELVRSPGLDVYITPPVGPEQQPWAVTLMRPRSNSNTYETLNRSGAAFDGHWHLDAVPSGPYRLEVRDHRNSTWLVREFQLDPLREPLFLELDSVAIQGTLSLGGEPSGGVVIFGTRQRRPNVAVTVKEGFFEAVLPREGEWNIEVELERAGRYSVLAEPVTIEQNAGGSYVSVDIELPDTLLEGEVLQAGELVSNAFVFVRGELDGNKTIIAKVRTDEDGVFSLQGLKPENLEVAAYLGAFDPASGWVQVDLKEDIAAPYLKLELLDKVAFQAQIISSHGPVAGAKIFVESRSSSLMTSWPAEAISQSDGVAHIRLPEESRGSQVLLMTLGAGYGFVMQHAQLGDQVIPVTLSPAKGILILKYPRGTLHSNGVAVPVLTVITKLLSANQATANPEGGVIFKGMAVGEYRQCSESGQGQDCDGGILTSGGTLELDITDVYSPEEKP